MVKMAHFCEGLRYKIRKQVTVQSINIALSMGQGNTRAKHKKQHIHTFCCGENIIVIINRESTTPDEWTALLVGKSNGAGRALAVNAIQPLKDPNEGKNGECEGGPVNEGRRTLMVKDCPQRPGDDYGTGEVTIDGRERVGSRSGLQEQEGEEHEDLGPDPGVVLGCVNTERLEGGQEDDNHGPPMPKGEWQMHEQFIAHSLGGMIFLNHVVDMADN